jgi:hypothetical protein
MMEPVVDEDGDNKVGKAHARKDESPEGAERPERHLEFAFRFSRVLEREDKTQTGHKKADCSQYAEDNKKQFVRQGSTLSVECGLQCWLDDLSDE